jgi:hypothetical protein
MVLTCDIAIATNNICINKEICRNFRNTMNSISYYDLKIIDDEIKSINIKNITDNFLCQFYSYYNPTFATYLPMAFYISSRTDEMFSDNKTIFEEKIISSANNLVNIICNYLDNFEQNDMKVSKKFFKSFDMFCSLYNCIVMRKIISKQTEFVDTLLELIRINYNTKNNNNKECCHILKQLFKKNQRFAIKLLLNNYKKIKNNKYVNDYLWKKILVNLNFSFHNMFIILISELEKKILLSLKTSIDRKDMYYNVNIDDIITGFINNTFTNDKIYNLIIITQDKIKLLNPNYHRHKNIFKVSTPSSLSSSNSSSSQSTNPLHHHTNDQASTIDTNKLCKIFRKMYNSI